MGTKVVVALSGGVDSAVTAWLLMQHGYDVTGATMQIWQEGQRSSAVEDAKEAARQLGIAHTVIDCRDQIQSMVIDPFIQAYEKGRTPNPCVLCNPLVKFDSILSYARQTGAEYIATGHYARICRTQEGRYTVKNAASEKRDQTYALCRLTQDQLAHTLMPLGEYEKSEIRAMAEQIGLNVARKPDSEEICFITDQDYASYIEEKTGSLCVPGNFVTRDGRILGQHRGIIHYTIGQRKRLNLSMGHPVYVTEIRPETNEVVIGEDEELYTDRLVCDNLNFMAWEDVEGDRRATVKIRYGHAGTPATVRRIGEDQLECVFDTPVRAVTPGQAAVIYDDEMVACAGEITA